MKFGPWVQFWKQISMLCLENLVCDLLPTFLFIKLQQWNLDHLYSFIIKYQYCLWITLSMMFWPNFLFLKSNSIRTIKYLTQVSDIGPSWPSCYYMLNEKLSNSSSQNPFARFHLNFTETFLRWPSITFVHPMLMRKKHGRQGRG